MLQGKAVAQILLTAGRKRVQSIIQRWGLPLQIDAEGPEEDNKVRQQTFLTCIGPPICPCQWIWAQAKL